MTPHEEDRPQTTRSRSSENWRTLPIILGAAAVVIIGTWLYTGRDEANPVTDGDAPASTQAPRK
jgi:hypothetical protein